MTTADQYTFQSPVDRYPSISPPVQDQPEPGLDRDMEPQTDRGEDSDGGTRRLAGRKALITGSDSAIGAAVAIAFAGEGADVAVSYLPVEEPDAEKVSALVRDCGRKAVHLPEAISELKAAINNFSRGLAQQLAPRWIRLNAVAPGPVWTPLQVSDGQSKEALPSAAKTHLWAWRGSQPPLPLRPYFQFRQNRARSVAKPSASTAEPANVTRPRHQCSA